jgi:hypothetical protein
MSVRVVATAALLVTLLAWPVFAGVLPEERADILYHSYDGGGVQISGPSLLVRKSAGKNFSIAANYYVDSVSSASIDVVTSASPYKEERTQESLDATYLHGKTLMGVGYMTSVENDYEAKTAHFTVSQDMFGDLTTVTLGYSRGWDLVGRTGDPEFAADTDRRSYSVGVSQILTKNMLLGLEFESITDEGFLNNPYRSVRYLDSQSAQGYSYEPELYPHTHTSGAFAARTRYYLPWRAALSAQYRYYNDTWDVTAHTGEVWPRTRSRTGSCSTSATATTRRRRRTSTATCSRAPRLSTSARATRNCRRSRARRYTSARPMTSRAAAGSSSRKAQ